MHCCSYKLMIDLLDCLDMNYNYNRRAYQPANEQVLLKGECSVVMKKNYILDEIDSLSEYIKIPLGHNRTNGAVYSKINFKVEICSAQ